MAIEAPRIKELEAQGKDNYNPSSRCPGVKAIEAHLAGLRWVIDRARGAREAPLTPGPYPSSR